MSLPMQWTSILAIYALIWIVCAFVLLPFGIKTHDEAHVEKIAGQADSAPVNFRPALVAKRATILAAILTILFVFNYANEWITAEDLVVWGPGRSS